MTGSHEVRGSIPLGSTTRIEKGSAVAEPFFFSGPSRPST